MADIIETILAKIKPYVLGWIAGGANSSRPQPPADHGHTGPGDGGVLQHHDQQGLSDDDHAQYAGAAGSSVSRAAGEAVHALDAERVNRTVTAGAGLSGGGKLSGDVSLAVAPGAGLNVDNGVGLNTPGGLSVTSPNQASGGHTHAIEASSAPVTESLVKTDSGGGVDLQRVSVEQALTAGAGSVKVTPGALRVNMAEILAGLSVAPSSDTQIALLVRARAGQAGPMPLVAIQNGAGRDLVRITKEGDLVGAGFVSGLAGWEINQEGDAEFRNLRARGELHSAVFVKDEVHATGGTLLVMTASNTQSGGQAGDNVIGSTFNLVVAGNLVDPSTCPFEIGDVLKLKFVAGKG